MKLPTSKSDRDRAAAGEGSLDAALRNRPVARTELARERRSSDQSTISEILSGHRSTLDAVVAGAQMNTRSERSAPAAIERPPALPRQVDATALPIKSIAELGSLVKAARRRLHLPQQRFADLAGVGRRFVSELEAGKPTLEADRVLRCCLAAGIDILARPRNQ